MLVNLLTVLFIGLKLTGYITWSWVWVLAPLWAGIAFVLLVFLITSLVDYIKDKNANTA